MKTLKRLLERFKKPFYKEKYKFYLGILIIKPLKKQIIKNGQTVLTDRGEIGFITSLYPSMFNIAPNSSIWLDVRLLNKVKKHVNRQNLYKMCIYIPLLNKTFDLSQSCYRYMLKSDRFKVFKVRLTLRGYAMLSNKVKLEREYIAILRKSLDSNTIIKLISSNYKIKKL